MVTASRRNIPSPPSTNALRLVLLLRDRHTLRLSEVGDHLDVASSTAHRLLAMVQYHGFVRQQAESQAYHPGSVLVEVGLSAQNDMPIRDLTHPLLEFLSSTTGETSHLAVLQGATVRYLDAVESDKALRVVNRSGMTLPAHCTSVGKAILAELTPEEVRAAYPDIRLAPATTRSKRSRGALERELTTVRRQGYATSREESEDGVSAVAVAVRTVLLPP